MAMTPSASSTGSFWSGRMVEWSVLVFVVLTLMWVFGRHVHEVKGQGERAAVKATLGALRTALLVEYLRTRVAAAPEQNKSQQTNPFLLLQGVPPNFAGELAAERISSAPQGSWVFDPACVCVGYRPLYPDWLESPNNTESLWFRIGTATGPLQITAADRYVWQGEVVQ